jgi:hypothetical protein
MGARVDAGGTRYEIRVEGDLSENWAAWFGAVRIAAKGGETTITAMIPDQSALHAVLNRVRDLRGSAEVYSYCAVGRTK